MSAVDINGLTSRVIRTGTVIGIAILAIGLLLSGINFGEKIMLAGVIILVMTPLAGILTSMTCLFKSGDRTWGMVSVVLVAVVVIGLLITLLK